MTVERLLKPAKLASFGNLVMKNHMVMAPMTRCRADTQGVLGDLTIEYYKQRSTAGLIISEACAISPGAKGYCRVPGMHTKAQIRAWRHIREAIHSAGSALFVQLWHSGRIGHPLNRNIPDPLVAPSAIQAHGQIWTDQSGMQDFAMPRALELAEIPKIVEDFAKATKAAINQAMCDGVELHAASGYLPHQFLSAAANRRTDAYGGSVTNRIRFTVECIDAMIQAAGSSSKVGIKISPVMGFNDIDPEGDVEDLYKALLEALNSRNLAFIEVLRSQKMDALSLVRQNYKGTVMAGGGYDGKTGEAALVKGEADLIAYGIPFIANPDLPNRFKSGAPLANPDPNTFYAGGASGYADYPALA